MAGMSSPQPHRRWYQFSLSTLLAVVTLASLVLGNVAWERERCVKGQQALDLLEQNPDSTSRKITKAPSTRPDWLKRLLGDDRFRGVKSVDLRGQFVTNSDLRGLGDFPNLHDVWIESPNVTDEGVAYFGRLKSVEKFTFVRNRRVSGESWGVLDRWYRLRSLSFEDSDFCNDDAPNFSALKSLQELDLSQTNIIQAGWNRVSLPTNLEVLNLSVTEVTDTDLQQLSQLTRLRTLDLSCTYVRGPGLANLPVPSKLEALNLSSSKISDEEVVWLSRLTNLRKLQLACTDVTDAGLARLAGLTRLESLDVSYNRISDNGLLHLRRLTNLKNLSLGHTRVTSSGLDELRKVMPTAIVNN